MLNMLIADMHYLLWTGYHAAKNRSDDPEYDIGLSLGIKIAFDNLWSYAQQMAADRIVFAFEGGGMSRRASLLPSYKSTRKNKPDESPEERDRRAEYSSLLASLPDRMLDCDLSAVWQDGYEADDMIALVAAEMNRRQQGLIIVSSDEDLFQCLSDRVVMFSPQRKEHERIRNAQWVIDEYGVGPHEWAKVKSLAGCSTDDIPGVPGVGEKTAAKFLTKQLTKGVKYEAIRSAIVHKIPCDPVANHKLVKLPFEGAALPEDWDRAGCSLSQKRELYTGLGFNPDLLS